MIRRSFLKNLFRSIWESKARFLSILAIIAIGVGFFAGINATEPDMIQSAKHYFEEANLADFQVVSPLGFRAKDIEEIKGLQWVDDVQAGYFNDLFLTTEQGNKEIVRLYSYSGEDKGQGVSKPSVKKGRMPKKPGEIAIDSRANGIDLGSTITLSMPEDEQLDGVLNQEAYKVVGYVYSPTYIAYGRGQTNIGDGSIDFFAYVHEDHFTFERYTDVLIRTKESKELTPYTDVYDQHIQQGEEILEDLGKEILSEEKEEIKAEIEEAKEELAEEKEKFQEEISKAKNDLLEAEKDIEEAEKELIEKEKTIAKELEEASNQLRDAEKQLKDGKKVYEENHKEWEENNKVYEQGKADQVQAKQELNESKKELEEAEKRLKDEKAQLKEAEKEISLLETSLRNIEQLQVEFMKNPPTTQEEYVKMIEQAQLMIQEIEETLKTLPIENPEIIVGAMQAISQETGVRVKKAKQEYEQGEKKYQKAIATIEEGWKTYEKGKAAFEVSIKELEAAEKKLMEGKHALEAAKKELEKSEQDLIEGRRELEQGEKDFHEEIKQAKKEIADGKQEIEDGWITLQEEEKEAEEEIHKAEEEIKEAEADYRDIRDEWMIQKRSDNPDYTAYGDDANRIGSVAKVFPFFFFLVAALVCLTTMTRMIEEERVQIGTMKALGYHTLAISSKYLFYALTSSVVGALIGLRIGFWLFPTAIMNAYGIMYTIPDRLTPYHIDYALISIGMALVTTVVAVLFAMVKELQSTPAALMRPKAPKPGKRIFLERITPLWSRFSFSQKVAFRNIFRYKQRFYMTILGIAGCTALLVTGFGLSDSIHDIIDKQFSEVSLYEGQIFIEDGENKAEFAKEQLLKDERIASQMLAYSEAIDVSSSSVDHAYEANLLIPETKEEIYDFIVFRNRRSDENLSFPEEGAIITEKLAELLDVQEGDYIHYQDADHRSYEVLVESITENYLYHYIYLSPEYAKSMMDKPLFPNTLFFQLESSLEDQRELKEDLMRLDPVLNVLIVEELSNTVSDTLKSLDYVVLILILSAATLAFVVLYNLTNINITERIREIATIKVLGFFNHEVDVYVYRENVILTILGTLLGLVLGIALHRYVIVTMEIDSMMFGREVHGLSFLWSVILTFLFAFFVNFIMHFKLKKVDMVESLKSIE